jgi:pyrroline-5-carboxylate reductase
MSSSSSLTPAVRVGFIGAGNMASALIRGMLERGVVPASSISVSSPSGAAALAPLGVHCTRDNAEVAQNSDVLILAVKPFMMEPVLKGLAGSDPTGSGAGAPPMIDRRRTVIVSIAAGTTIETITGLLHGTPSGLPPWRILRVMPNTPAQVLQGASAMCLGGDATEGDGALVKRLFEAVGVVQVVKESHMDGE